MAYQVLSPQQLVVAPGGTAIPTQQQAAYPQQVAFVTPEQALALGNDPTAIAAILNPSPQPALSSVPEQRAFRPITPQSKSGSPSNLIGSQAATPLPVASQAITPQLRSSQAPVAQARASRATTPQPPGLFPQVAPNSAQTSRRVSYIEVEDMRNVSSAEAMEMDPEGVSYIDVKNTLEGEPVENPEGVTYIDVRNTQGLPLAMDEKNEGSSYVTVGEPLVKPKPIVNPPGYDMLSNGLAEGTIEHTMTSGKHHVQVLSLDESKMWTGENLITIDVDNGEKRIGNQVHVGDVKEIKKPEEEEKTGVIEEEKKEEVINDGRDSNNNDNKPTDSLCNNVNVIAVDPDEDFTKPPEECKPVEKKSKWKGLLKQSRKEKPKKGKKGEKVSLLVNKSTREQIEHQIVQKEWVREPVDLPANIIQEGVSTVNVVGDSNPRQIPIIDVDVSQMPKPREITVKHLEPIDDKPEKLKQKKLKKKKQLAVEEKSIIIGETQLDNHQMCHTAVADPNGYTYCQRDHPKKANKCDCQKDESTVARAIIDAEVIYEDTYDYLYSRSQRSLPMPQNPEAEYIIEPSKYRRRNVKCQITTPIEYEREWEKSGPYMKTPPVTHTNTGTLVHFGDKDYRRSSMAYRNKFGPAKIYQEEDMNVTSRNREFSTQTQTGRRRDRSIEDDRMKKKPEKDKPRKKSRSHESSSSDSESEGSSSSSSSNLDSSSESSSSSSEDKKKKKKKRNSKKASGKVKEHQKKQKKERVEKPLLKSLRRNKEEDKTKAVKRRTSAMKKIQTDVYKDDRKSRELQQRSSAMKKTQTDTVREYGRLGEIKRQGSFTKKTQTDAYNTDDVPDIKNLKSKLKKTNREVNKQIQTEAEAEDTFEAIEEEQTGSVTPKRTGSFKTVPAVLRPRSELRKQIEPDSYLTDSSGSESDSSENSQQRAAKYGRNARRLSKLDAIKKPVNIPTKVVNATVVKPLTRLHHTPQLLGLFSSRTYDSHPSKKCRPTGLCIASNGNYVVIDCVDKSVKIFNTMGQLRVEFGKEILKKPWGAVILSDGNLAVTDPGSASVKVFSNKGKFVREFKFDLKEPYGIAVSSIGHVIVSDKGADGVYVFYQNGELKGFLKNADRGRQPFGLWPQYLVTDKNDNIILSDYKTHHVRMFNPKGEFQWEYGGLGIGTAQLISPQGVCVDEHGHILVADSGNSRVKLLSPGGDFIRDLVTKQHGLENPEAIAIDAKGNLVVTQDSGEVKIFKYVN